MSWMVAVAWIFPVLEMFATCITVQQRAHIIHYAGFVHGLVSPNLLSSLVAVCVASHSAEFNIFSIRKNIEHRLSLHNTAHRTPYYVTKIKSNFISALP